MLLGLVKFEEIHEEFIANYVGAPKIASNCSNRETGRETMRKLVIFFLWLGAFAVTAKVVHHYGSETEGALKVYVGEPVAASFSSGSDVVHGFDDFISKDITSSKNWAYVGTTPMSFVPGEPAHPGILSIPTGTTIGINELIGSQVCAKPTPNFSGIDKCVVRFVVSCDALFTGSDGFDGEWYIGIADPDGRGNVHAGAMLNFAPGFTDNRSTELLAGSYTSQHDRTYERTGFKIEPKTWYDLIISWTPTVIKYYAAVYGESPKLVATITTHISTDPQHLIVGNSRYRNGSPSVNLLVDKVEWLYKTSQSGSYLEENLVKY
jgi:hypothetical protein